ncbi:TetR/AcrR family transcriptional regulator [Nocardioides baekrokdamisoli]|uniref:TetR/AcrR family transcriptional regulator n=1 Tax=Nocardioides baekrokdamisoli TaxID=1804624 RepID=UPI0013DE4BA7|nr:TetR family transcriptional regulator [Nocardioides baekrokdamisoli]
MTSAPRRTQHERRDASRTALIGATLELLDEVGYANLSVADICERAGRSVGTHLHHFGTKSALVAAAVDHLADVRITAMRAELVEHPRSGLDAALDIGWSFYRGPTFLVALELWNAARTDPELRDHLLRVEENIDREALALMSELASGAVGEEDIRGTRFAVASMRGLAMRRALYGDTGIDYAWTQMKPLLLKALS